MRNACVLTWLWISCVQLSLFCHTFSSFFPHSVLPSSSNGAAISIHSEIFSFLLFLRSSSVCLWFFSLQTSSFRPLHIMNGVFLWLVHRQHRISCTALSSSRFFWRSSVKLPLEILRELPAYFTDTHLDSHILVLPSLFTKWHHLESLHTYAWLQ